MAFYTWPLRFPLLHCLLFQPIYIFTHRHHGLPAEFFFGFRGIDYGVHAVAGALWQHFNVVRKHFGDVENRVAFGRAETIVISLTFLTHHEKPACEIVDVREIALLRPWRAHGDRFPLFVESLKNPDDAPVLWIGTLTRAVGVVKVGYCIRQIEPGAIVAHEFGVGRLHPCIWAAVATHAAVSEFS